MDTHTSQSGAYEGKRKPCFFFLSSSLAVSLCLKKKQDDRADSFSSNCCDKPTAGQNSKKVSLHQRKIIQKRRNKWRRKTWFTFLMDGRCNIDFVCFRDTKAYIIYENSTEKMKNEFVYILTKRKTDLSVRKKGRPEKGDKVSWRDVWHKERALFDCLTAPQFIIEADRTPGHRKEKWRIKVIINNSVV